MRLLGVQYYRPPFPDRERWFEDLSDIAAAGFDTVQFWVVWGWVESTPGQYQFEDYDTLINLADQVGLKVVLSTIGEIHPFWLPRVIPDSATVDHLGRTQTSSLRGECNVGLTPGGCIDHPQVMRRMSLFLTAVARHFGGRENLVAIDLWNETRWSVESDGFLCYCDYTVSRFRSWLQERYGSLDGLNAAWRRRYSSWEDVQPGKKPDMPYTDNVAFQEFLVWRCRDHLEKRVQATRQGCPDVFLSAHSADPSPAFSGFAFERALSRGNDFELAPLVDSWGSSHFPIIQAYGDDEFRVRIQCGVGAAWNNEAWISELQGGSGRQGLEVQPPVTASQQQTWLWSALSRGVTSVLFWCWRDEVFGRESSGWGLAGADGRAEERIAAMRTARAALIALDESLQTYEPEPATVGLVFSPRGHLLDWAQSGAEANSSRDSFFGWGLALEAANVPYRVLDADALDGLERLRVLLIPWPLALPASAISRIAAWVRDGGILISESEYGAYDDESFYRAPDLRSAELQLDFLSRGRRPLAGELPLAVTQSSLRLGGSEWLEDLRGPDGSEGNVLDYPLGSGRVVMFGSFPGIAFARGAGQLDAFVDEICGQVDNVLTLRGAQQGVRFTSGRTQTGRLVFAFGEPGQQISLSSSLALAKAKGVLGEAAIEGRHLQLETNDWGIAVADLQYR